MKTKRKVSTRFVKKALGGAIFLLSATAAPAIDRVWNSGESNNWNDYFNWSPAVPPAPVAPGFSAIFDESTVTEPTLTDTVTIESIIFNAGADIYTIQTNGNVLTLQGAGIVNNSGSLQTINNDNVEAVGQTIFTNFASAGTVVITNSGEGSSTQFLNNSTAGNATIANNGANTLTLFFNSSTAGAASIANSGPNSATGFLDNSTAGNATIANNGANTLTAFFNSSTAGAASIANNGANTLTLFFNSSTAGAASIANSGPNTATGFLDNSSAGNATIVNSGQSSGTGFLGNSSAANATITNSGANSFVVFTQGASGGNASLINANPTAFITIAELNGPGTTVGSIAGTGTIFLGSKNLTVGGNQQSSVFSGVISDGEASGLPPAVLTAQSSYVGGSLTKVGAGTLTLAGANTYTGGTTIAGGTILTQNASALGTGPVSFGNGSTLAVQNLLNVNGNWTISSGTATVNGGSVQTVGDFDLGGGGTLIANANFNVPGAANINSSGFVVNTVFTADQNVNLNGSTAAIVNGILNSPIVNVNGASSLLVNTSGRVAANVNVGTNAALGLFGRINGNVTNGGFFQGTGLVNGNVVNNGTVAPGASVGRLTINGNYTQSPGGTLRIEVAGSSPGQFDLLAVNGRASVAGTVQLVSVGGFNLRVGDRIVFLTATNDVSGTFSTVQSDFVSGGPLVAFGVVYLPNGVVLEAIQGSFAGFAAAFCGTPNAVAVGQALDSAVGDPRASELIGFLNSRTPSELCNDIDLISPEQLTSIFVIGVSLANVQTANLERRMDDIQAGSRGWSSSGLTINNNLSSFSEGFAGVNGPEGKSGQPVFAPIPENRWGVFVTGIGEFTNVDSTFNASGYDLATGGFTMGVDYRIGSNFAIGITGGYAYTGANLVNDGSIQVNGGKLGLYATAFGSGFYLDTAVIGGLNGYETRRTALEGTASGRTDGGDLNVLVAGGYDWKKGGLSIGPTASFQYTYVGLGAFSESGSLAPLAFPNQHADSLRTAFGAKGSYDWKIGPVHFVPEVRAAWQHEFGDTDYSLLASFANGAGNGFTVNGPAIGRDSLLLSAGFAIQWSERISTYAYYDGELFRTNYLSNNVSAGFRVTF